MNLETAITTFLLSQPNLGTRKAYRSCLIPMQDYIGPARPVAEVNVAEVVAYSSNLYNKNYAQATIRKHVITVKAFFNWLKRMELITKSPADAVKRPKRERNIDRNKAMTEDQLSLLLSYTRFKPRHNALVRFLADTGCRIGGAHTLKISDIMFDKNTAEVTEKGSKKRFVAFGDETKKAIQNWIDSRPADACDYVFANGKTNIKVGNLGQLFRRACIAAGVGSVGPHSLRHRKGYQLSDNRVSISIASTVLGHESSDTTLHYYPKDWDRAKAALQELALPNEDKHSPNIVQFRTKRVE